MTAAHLLLVTGTRSPKREDEATIERRLQSFYETLTCPLVVLAGGAGGVDSIADLWARKAWSNGAKVYPISHPAEWGLFRMLGDAGKAGSLRNEEMVQRALVFKRMVTGSSVSCLAFPSKGSIGTWDCVRRCKRVAIRVEVCEL